MTTEKLHEVVKFVTAPEFDKIWEEIQKVEVTAIKAASESATAKAKLRTYEAKLYRLIDENADLRELIRKMTSDE
jgi:hypothetical protein